VHTPEFAFEHVLSNVEHATKDLGVTWPVALDNDYGTWTAWNNQYWPAEYLIDKNGNVRHFSFGESDYDGTEKAIRALLAEAGATKVPAPTKVADLTPIEQVTPESYLGSERLARYVGSPLKPDVPAQYTFAKSIPLDDLSYDGMWTVGKQRIVAGMGARLRLHFEARYVYLVLGGHGTVKTLVNGKPAKTLQVTMDKLYTVVSGTYAHEGLLELQMSPGVNAYAFTFG
jgi:hypothetical protein